MPQTNVTLTCLGCGRKIDMSLGSFSYRSGPRCPDCDNDANLESQLLWLDAHDRKLLEKGGG